MRVWISIGNFSENMDLDACCSDLTGWLAGLGTCTTARRGRTRPPLNSLTYYLECPGEKSLATDGGLSDEASG